jgi:predicted dehydrogenase
VQLDEGVNENALQSSLKQFVSVLLQGASHPLSGDSGLKDLEIVMAIYESARLRARVNLPLGQPRYPLEIMIEEGQM